MQRKESFTALDFDDVWKIDEETYPYLRTLFSAYELWLKDVGIIDDMETEDMPKPEDMVEGIPVGVRYVFDRPEGVFSPWTGISFTDDGDVVISMLPVVNGEGVTVTVQATEDLTDWDNAAEYPVDSATGICVLDFNPTPPKMFFKYSIDVDAN